MEAERSPKPLESSKTAVAEHQQVGIASREVKNAAANSVSRPQRNGRVATAGGGAINDTALAAGLEY